MGMGMGGGLVCCSYAAAQSHVSLTHCPQVHIIRFIALVREVHIFRKKSRLECFFNPLKTST